MKIIINILSSIILAMLLLCSCSNNDNILKDNAIKIGTAKVVVKLIDITNPPDTANLSDSIYFSKEFLSYLDTLDLKNVEIIAGSLPIFEYYNDEFISLKRINSADGNIVFKGELPMECLSQLCMVILTSDGTREGGTEVLLTQGEETIVEFILKDGQLQYTRILDPNQPTAKELWDIDMIMINQAGMHHPEFAPTDKSLYDVSWQAVRKNQYDSVWPRFIDSAVGEYVIPESAEPWVMNNLKCRFAARSICEYTRTAEIVTGKKYEEPPMEAYTYLDSIDYSPNVFLMKTLIMSQRPFLSSLLKYAGGGFEAIGETPVKEWQEKLSEWLDPAMKERPKLLLDLLAGTSYYQQIEENQPLSDVQKKNIEEGFTDDIGKIVLKRNEKLEEALSAKVNLQDLSEQTFALQEFIDKTYPGQPVVVDMWNTWCGPCLQAMAQTEEIKGDYEDTNLVFLYVSDTSSGLKEWENRARMTGGEQVRISEESKDGMMNKYSLEGFPSYLFFDRDHKLVHAQTAFPGLDRYRALLNQITGK